MPLAAASLYNFEARKSKPALGRRAAPTSLAQRAAPQALGANSSAAAAERRLWKWYVDRLLMFDQYETPPQWEVIGGDVAEFAAPHFHIVPGKTRAEAAALHLQRAWRTQRARRVTARRGVAEGVAEQIPLARAPAGGDAEGVKAGTARGRHA